VKSVQKVLSSIAQGSEIIRLLAFGLNEIKPSAQRAAVTHSVCMVGLEE